MMGKNPLHVFDIPLEGIHLIEASAGTGKTYNIASIYVRSLIEMDLAVKDILVVTYTEAATKELRERLMSRLRESVLALENENPLNDDFLIDLKETVVDHETAVEKLKKAIRSFDESAIYTIHGFCFQALQEQAFESRAMFDAELIGDDKEIIREVIDDYWRLFVRRTTDKREYRPLLKFVMDKGFNPDVLTQEFSSYVGKPYLNVYPKEFEPENLEESLIRLTEIFEQMKEEWEGSRKEIFEMLDEGHLSNYRTGWLEGWVAKMDQWISSEVAPIELFDQFRKFTQSVIDDSLKKSSIKKGKSPPNHPFFELADSFKDIAETLNKYDITFRLDLFKHLKKSLFGKKEELRQLSYDDLLTRLNEALTDGDRGRRLSQSLRRAYPIALVDEFQDTDPIQYNIFKTIYRESGKKAALFMIGDPKQSIYSFRGADIYSYLEAKKDAPSDRTYSLNRNFRSIPELIDATNHLFSYRDNPFILDDIPYSAVKAGKQSDKYKRLNIDDEPAIPIEFRELHSSTDDTPVNKKTAEQRSAEDTASRIELLLRQSKEGRAVIGEKPVEAADIAVLVRKHYQADMIRDSLKTRGIKSVQYSQDSVFKSEEAEDLQIILKAIAEPAQEGFVRAALATKAMGYNAKELLQFEADDSLWVEKLNQFNGWHEAWKNNGFGYMFRKFVHEENIAEEVIKRGDGERKLTNLIHLSELLQNKEEEGKTGTRSLLQWLARKRNETDKDREEEQLRLESDENLVKVVTMHRSKGLEYPIVFCPFLWHSPEYDDKGGPIIYHDRNNETKVNLDFYGKDDPDRGIKRFQMAQEDLAESVRLAYVAITRAEQKCFISWVHAKKSEFSPLGYLLLGQEKAFGALQGVIKKNGKKTVETTVFKNTINELMRRHDHLFSFRHSADGGQQQLFLDTSSEKLDKARLFKRQAPLKAGYSISSFSSLIQNRDDDFEIDYDILLENETDEVAESSAKIELTIFNFPKGPNPGTAIHHIFEEISFGDLGNAENIIEEALNRQDIDPKWRDVVFKMIKQTLSKNLLGEGGPLHLEDIEPEYIMPEMEFFFSSGHARLPDLLKIIRGTNHIPDTISGMSEEGYIKGFIDLTFRFNNKFYILDYKTNHLGNETDKYRREALESEIKEAMYDLQYHLYILALHRYLTKSIEQYSYDTHIGGAFYLFIRGINKQGREGIYFDHPDSSLIHKLDEYLRR
ncbi:exodeoxyribonuclease V subunit beta [Balneolaceae bacterium YR4-1]|uniref:DNA 3'-5' helicase n=2 Tax=Halalkalibaculum roseum TaxID=2709311 RepID=A0A6M1T0Q7_9BACT|nr:exodeoxyribonuclease V subunit beta [Halalkalibaculum roseum]